MKLEELLSLCQFKSFPFDLKPSQSPEVWAGRKDILDELMLFKKNVIEDNLTEFGVVCGDYGSGKSQTLLHLRHLVEEDARQNGYDVLCIYIPNPCGLGAKQSFVENYQYLVGQGIGQEKMKKICKGAKDVIQASISETMSKEELAEMLRDTSTQEAKYKGKYATLMTDPPIPYELLDSLIGDDPIAWEWIGSQKAINRIGSISVQPLTSHIICARTLAQLILLATTSLTEAKESSYKAVFILVDQAEDLANLPARSFQEHMTGWRSLIDETGNNLGLLWAMDGAAEDIAANFSVPLQRRQTVDPRKLSLPLLYDDEPMEFLTQIITSFRKEEANVPTETYPFTKEALEEIITQTSDTTPANLLINCRRVFTHAAAHNQVTKLTDEIDKDYVLRSI